MKYTLYIVTRDQDHHYPVLIGNNGKPVLNEPVSRASKLQKSWDRLIAAVYAGETTTVKISEKEFKKKFPKFPVNAGKKKTTKPKA